MAERPGIPDSTEIAIHIGFLRAGWPGLIAAGVSFIAPAMVIVLCLAWTYVRYGAAPEVAWLLYGNKPVVIAIVAQALWKLGRTVIKGALTGDIGITVFVSYFLGVNEIAMLFAGGLVVMIEMNMGRRWPGL